MAASCCRLERAKKCDDLINFASPLDAFRCGPREKFMYVTCVNVNSKKPDYLAVIDVDDDSENFCKVIHRLYMTHVGDELHHFGWNHCTGCKLTPGDMKRTHLLLPTLHSSRVYVVNVAKDPLHPVLEKSIDLKQFGFTFPHTTHCLPNGKILISTLGDEKNSAVGNFAQIDGDTFEFEQKWSDSVPFGYDFWYQPRHNVMVSSSWGPPSAIKSGLNPADLAKYGHFLYVWNWTTRKLETTMDLGEGDGCMVLEVRMCHDPASFHGYVVTGIGSSLFHFCKDEQNVWKCDRVVKVDPLEVSGFAMDSMPAVFTDFIISMDDRFIYISAWIHGFIRQYNIDDKFSPRLTSQIYIGGSIIKGGLVTVLEDGFEQPDPLVVKQTKVEGGAQMLQLSLDGKRLFVTTSLYSVWDKEFYPDLIKNGASMLRINVDLEREKMEVDECFLVDFGKEPDGPALAHEMRYPGGDCSSDIFI